MDFLRAGELLLRSSPPLLPFLAPSAYRSQRIATISQHHRARPLQSPTSRPFTTSLSQEQQNAAAAKEDNNDSNDPPQPATSSKTDEFSRLLDSALDSSKGVPTAPTGRTSRFKTPSAQTYNSPSRVVARNQQQQYNDPPTRNPDGAQTTPKGSMDELLTAMRTQSRPTSRSTAPARQFPGASPAPASPSSAASTLDGFDISSLLDPMSNTATTTTSPPPPAVPQVAPMKLNSSVGRTIQVDAARGMDVAKAFRALEMQCARNSVKRDFMRQRFHERPGLKRKRLKRERWRRRFKENFKGVVGMVQRMRGQGW